MSSSGKLRSASMRLHAALAALPSAGFAAACVFGAATSMADTAVTTGLNAFSTESTLDLGALAQPHPVGQPEAADRKHSSCANKILLVRARGATICCSFSPCEGEHSTTGVLAPE